MKRPIQSRQTANYLTTFLRPLVSLHEKIYTRIQTINELAKPILVFRLKGFKNQTLWGGTYLYY